MDAGLKVVLSLGGAFLTGFTTAYYSQPAATSWLPWIMGGLASVAPYLVGLYQLKPGDKQ